MSNQLQVFVRGMDGNLWLEHAPFNSVPPSRIQIAEFVETA
ncbi:MULTISPECIES: hypothetical protein [Legionella]|nr:MULTISPECIES: hypothetical protein [Legionella]